MRNARSPIISLWHQIRARTRLSVSVATGLLAFLILPQTLAISSRLLVAWDIGAGLYLLLAWFMMERASVEHMRWRSRIQDDGAAAVLFLTITAAIASLAAIILELTHLKNAMPFEQNRHLVLAGITFLASWLLVHTSFALHYAHVYYISVGQNGGPPLEFPRQEIPVYPDFLYFAIIIGMTSQTADVAIVSTRMRRLAMVHGMISFIFNTTLLALTINIAASLLG